MADSEMIEQAATAEPEAFHVKLSENSDGRVFVESDDEADDTEATESAQEAGTEKAEDKTFLSDDDKDVDLNDPAYKAAYARLLKSYTRKVQGIQKQVAAEPTPQAQTTPVEAPPQTAATGEWDPYTVPLDTFVYKGEPEAADSELAGFESAIDRRVEAGVKKAIEFTLNQMRVNDGRLREMQQVGTAKQRIEAYVGELMEHPEGPERAAELSSIANKPWARQMAVEDPEAFIGMLEEKSGIKRDWREKATASDSDRGQQNQRLANKPRAVVQRPTQTARPPLGAGQSAGTYRGEEGFEVAWQGRR